MSILRANTRSYAYKKFIAWTNARREAAISETFPILSCLGPDDGRRISPKHNLFKHICSWCDSLHYEHSQLANRNTKNTFKDLL